MTHVPFEDLPPEMQAAIAAQYEAAQNNHDLRHMAIEDSRHRTLGFIESLNEEQLLVFRGIVTAVMRDPDNETGGWYLGFTTSALAKLPKLGYCGICADKHAGMDELLKADESEDEVTPSTNEDVEKFRIQRRDLGHIADRTRMFTDEETQDLVEYTLRLDPEGGYICSGCGLVKYPSLEDRKLRDPGPRGCHGCTQTTKWGGAEPSYDPDLAPKDQ